MLEKFLDKTSFESYEDFMENFHVNVRRTSTSDTM